MNVTVKPKLSQFVNESRTLDSENGAHYLRNIYISECTLKTKSHDNLQTGFKVKTIYMNVQMQFKPPFCIYEMAWTDP